MKIRLLITVLTASFLATLSLPLAASAASVGMSSTVIIPSPHKLTAGQTQYASYAVTAGTRPAKITVEWYRIRNPRLSADFDHNREIVVPEKSLGNSMTGGDTYTIPANPVAGHYGVMFRYYAQSTTTVGASTYTIPGNIEATANNSFYVENVDVCPNIAGIQTVKPAHLVFDGTLCVEPVVPVAISPPVASPPAPQVATPAGTTAKPKLSVIKKGNRKLVKQGQRVRFTIRVKNTGNAVARNIRVCDLLPAGMVYVSHTRKAVFERGGRVCWTVKHVPKKKTVLAGTLTVSVTRARGKVVNRACLMRGKTRRTYGCSTAAVRIIARKPQPTGGVTG